MVHVSRFRSGPIGYIQTLHRTLWSFSGHSVFIKQNCIRISNHRALATQAEDAPMTEGYNPIHEMYIL